MDTFSQQISSKIRQTAVQLSKYTAILKNALPPECGPYFNVATIQNKTITIVADSPVWTTRLRQLGPLILEAMKANTPQDLHHVKIITRHGTTTVDNHTQKPVKRHLSSESGKVIEQTASYLDDEQLSNALRKLSKRR